MSEIQGPRYKIEREIGRGAFGVVYLARDNLLRRDVALKVMSIPDGLTEDEKQHLVDRFYRETRAAAGLSHQNVVIIHDISKAKDRHFISMEFLEGVPLSEVISGEPMPLGQALQVADQVLAGLEYAHSREVIHRDVKPDNIFLSGSDGVKLVDFGLARIQASTTITQSGTVMGSPGYIAPEVIDGKPADKRTDVFSFGAVFYEMLTGVRPFGPDNAFESFVRVIYRIMSEDPKPPSTLNEAVPAQIDEVVAGMLAKDPDDRYQDGGDARRALAAAAESLDLEVEAAPDRRRKRARAPKASRDDAAATGVMAEALTVAGGGEPAEPEADVTRTEILQFSRDLESEGSQKRGFVRRHWKGIAVGGGAAALSGLAVLMLFVFGAFNLSEVKVPYLINLERNVAVQTIRKAGLKTGTVEDVFAYEFARGRVSKQRPNDGTRVPRNSKVNIEVSLGNKVAQVPKDVIGMPAQQARETLISYQFKVKQETGFSTTIPVGSVVATRPAPGTLLAYGETVTMIVNNGVRPKDFVEPPNGSTPLPPSQQNGSRPVLPAPQP